METVSKKIGNDLRHTIEAQDKDGNQLKIKIRLNDECGNGHQDFSITGDSWEAGQPRIDRYSMGGGCIHDQILKVRPDLQIFVNLHLCDYTGVPMHAVASGFYHLHEQMNNAKPGTKEHTKRFCEYYRITIQQFNQLHKAENKIRFAILLDKLGILKQWKEEANKGIELMEKMTGEKFVIDSKRTQYEAPTPAQIKAEEDKEGEGFYTLAKINERKRQAQIDAKEKQYKEIEEERDKHTHKAQLEYMVKKAVLDAGLSLDNFIFYNHSKEGAFNWKDYGSHAKVTEKELSKLQYSESVKQLQIKYGVIFRIDKA